jgi:hypothetical protein
MLSLTVQSFLEWGSGRSPESRMRLPSHRQGLIDQVLELNPGATADFLGTFSERALEQYAQHLRICADRRGRDTAWVRESGRPAITRVEAE